jgi:catechol 2,3-dioxygenase-like lactoylglutathione lyase family enzyme
MPSHCNFDAGDIAAVLTYIRNAWTSMPRESISTKDVLLVSADPGSPMCGIHALQMHVGDKLAIKLSAGGVVAPGPGFHVAFAAPSRAAVARFHAAALENGGQDNGAPGLRPQYGENYYAAFVIDPDGYRVEAVIDAPA